MARDEAFQKTAFSGAWPFRMRREHPFYGVQQPFRDLIVF
jgi:hypothetical protein